MQGFFPALLYQPRRNAISIAVAALSGFDIDVQFPQQRLFISKQELSLDLLAIDLRYTASTVR
jgi:hypothetical protein